MPIYEVQGPDGKIYEIEGPEGATIDQLAAVIGGGTAPAAAPKMSYGETAADVAKSLGTGVVRGVIGLAGMPADIGRGLSNLVIRGGGYLLGADQEKLAAEAARAQEIMSGMGTAPPTSAEITQNVERVTGPLYTPRGTAGEYARTIGEFVPTAVTGPGGIVRKAAMAAVPGTLSEAGGQLMEGTEYETAARIAGGLVGGVAAAGRGGGGTAKAMQEAAPDLATVTARKSSLYKKLENSGITFDGYDYANFADSVTRKLTRASFDPNLQPKTAVLLRRINALSGKTPTFQEMDNLRKMAGDILRGSGEPSDLQFAGKILRDIDDFFDSGVVSSANPQLPAGQVNAAVKEARELSRRTALARDINFMDRRSPYFQGGVENEFRKYMRSRRGERLTEAEKKAFDAVALREGLLDYASNKSGPLAGGAVGFVTGGGPGGALVGAGLTAAAQAGIKKIAEASSAKQVEAALKTVLAGRSAQNKMLRDFANEVANNRMRAIAAGAATVQSSENRNAMAR